METQETTETWTIQQRMYINFLAAGKVDTKGKRWTREEFARDILKVSPETLYRWQHLTGFKLAVFEESLGRRIDFIPQMLDAQVFKAIKQKDTPAFLAMMRQWELLKSDKIDTKSDNYTEVKYTFGASDVSTGS